MKCQFGDGYECDKEATNVFGGKKKKYYCIKHYRDLRLVFGTIIDMTVEEVKTQ